MPDLTTKQVIRNYNLSILGDIEMDEHVSKCIDMLENHYSSISIYNRYYWNYYGTNKNYILFSYNIKSKHLRVDLHHLPIEIQYKYSFKQIDFEDLNIWFIKTGMKYPNYISTDMAVGMSLNTQCAKFVETIELKI